MRAYGPVSEQNLIVRAEVVRTPLQEILITCHAERVGHLWRPVVVHWRANGDRFTRRLDSGWHRWRWVAEKRALSALTKQAAGLRKLDAATLAQRAKQAGADD